MIWNDTGEVMNFVGLGSAIIALILGIAAYKIIMGMVGFIRGSLEVVCVVICCTCGAALVAAAIYCVVELIHRRQIYNTQYRARSVIIDQIESGRIHTSIDLTHPVDAMLNSNMRQPMIDKPRDVFDLMPADQVPEIEPAEAEVVAELEPPPRPKRKWDELVAEMQEFRAWDALHGDERE